MFKQANTPVKNNPKNGDVLARPDWPVFLRRVLSDQRDLCRSLEAMCERQSVLVRGGDTDGLMRVLSQRQALVDRLAELGDEVAPFRAQWETCMASVNAPDRAEIERVVAEITDLIERIGKHDDSDRAALETQRATLSVELSTVNRGRGALGAYTGYSSTADDGPRFQDCNG